MTTIAELAKAYAVLEALGVEPRDLLAYEVLREALDETDGESPEAAELIRMRADDATAPACLGQRVYEQAAKLAEAL